MKPIIIGAVVVIILVIFISQAGVLKNVSFSNIFSPTKDFYSGINLSGSSSTFSSYGVSSTGSGSSISPVNIPKGFKAKDLSLYFGQITLSAVPRSEGSPYDLMTLSAASVASSGISLGGWYVRSNTATVYIPRAVPSFNPTAIPVSQDIVLKSSETVKAYSSVSPLGFNFKLNKCSGYINNRYEFNPPLDGNCPSPDRQDFATLSGLCQDYILGLANCQAPDFSLPQVSEQSCRSYLNSLDYPGCYLGHKKDADFALPEWDVWLGRSFTDPLHDRLLLFDKKGLLVDQFIY